MGWVRLPNGRVENGLTGMRIPKRSYVLEIALALAVSLGPLMRPPKLN